MNEITEKIIRLKHYDKEGFVYQLDYLVGQLHYFYNVIVPKQTPTDEIPNPSRAYFYPKPARPKEGQVAYFNLTRGFPKELYDGHYCYILKDLKTRFLVVPTTSVKTDSRDPDPSVEFDIKLDGFPNDKATRFHVDGMRSLDVQRVNPLKGFYNPITPQEDVLKSIFMRLGIDRVGISLVSTDVDKIIEKE